MTREPSRSLQRARAGSCSPTNTSQPRVARAWRASAAAASRSPGACTGPSWSPAPWPMKRRTRRGRVAHRYSGSTATSRPSAESPATDQRPPFPAVVTPPARRPLMRPKRVAPSGGQRRPLAGELVQPHHLDPPRPPGDLLPTAARPPAAGDPAVAPARRRRPPGGFLVGVCCPLAGRPMCGTTLRVTAAALRPTRWAPMSAKPRWGSSTTRRISNSGVAREFQPERAVRPWL